MSEMQLTVRKLLSLDKENQFRNLFERRCIAEAAILYCNLKVGFLRMADSGPGQARTGG